MADIRPVTKIEGPDASDAPTTQNPLVVGGRASTAIPTAVSADGDAVAGWHLRNGAYIAAIAGPNGEGPAQVYTSDGGDGLTPNDDHLLVLSHPGLWNGTGWDRARGNVAGAWVQGTVPTDTAVNAQPLLSGGRASDTVVTPVSADGDAVPLWLSRRGAVMVGNALHVPYDGAPFSLQPKGAQYTTTQTGTALVTPTGGKKLVVTDFTITCTGTVGGNVQLWFGGAADTTFTRGTDRAIHDGNFQPSATFSPGISRGGLWIAGAADDILRVTDDAAINALTINVWYYEI